MRALSEPSRALWVLVLGCTAACAQSRLPSEAALNHYLATVRGEPTRLLAFLRELPKGGDLHNHLAGSVYAEDLIRFAAQDGLCLERATYSLTAGPCDSSCTGAQSTRPAIECGYRDPDLYSALIDAWSMRNWERGHDSGHDHFFRSFLKFDRAFTAHVGEAMAAATARAAADHLEYLELMHTAGGMRSAELGAKLGWEPDFSRMRQKLLEGGLRDVVGTAREELDHHEKVARDQLACGTSASSAACRVKVRYLYQVLRGLPPEQVFAQILTGFELASQDSRVVGLNLVMPEDWYVPMRDFDLHMKMVDYLRGFYPRVHISLHAGELAMGLVPPESLSFHIRESIEIGHAERIGHGVDVMNEHKPFELLKEMAARKVLVEICLTSNDIILGVKGQDHPFQTYRQFKVPVALATDDEGVSRSDMTHEYLRAVESYALSYSDLKQMARDSLEHSFLPGASLWATDATFRRVEDCALDRPGQTSLSPGCKKFLDKSEKASVQWGLEQDFASFESKF